MEQLKTKIIDETGKWLHLDPKYHDFSNKETIMGVPNFWNTVTNIPIILASLYGLYRSKHFLHQAFFIGGVITGIASMHYHLAPDNYSLMIDRMAMSIMMTSLIMMLISSKYLKASFGDRMYQLAFMIAGVVGVFISHESNNLLPYATLQAMTGVIYITRNNFTGLPGFFIPAFYILSRVFELADYYYKMPFGHPLKHLFSAVSIFLIGAAI